MSTSGGGGGGADSAIKRSGSGDKTAADSRRTYILRVVSHILSLNLVEEKMPNVQALHNFCDEANTTLLVVARLDQASDGHYTRDLLFETNQSNSF